MSATVTRDAEGTVTGNTYDKYGSSNPVVRRLMATFERTLGELLSRAQPTSLLDVGCGEAVLLHRWARRWPGSRFVGFDLEDAALQAQWARRTAPNLEYRVMKLGEREPFPFADGEFAVTTAIEVLEHVPDPEHTLAEMARVARGGHLLVSVPREPLWRALNVARGAYLRELGNTPGHVNHWSKRGFQGLLARYGTVVEARSPFPWTMLLVRT
jgi:2-polyprenyl-3-methyl-5-hydroxy-6-metoxy-1,4-benzoquinol methylase